MISEEQIERFFAKQCTPAEAEQVAAWLQAHPEAAANYLDEKEWDNLVPNEHLPEETSQEIWDQVTKKIRKQKLYVLLKRSAIAALLAGCIAMCFLYTSKNKPVSSLVAYPKAKPILLITLTDTEYNDSHIARRILLNDSSVISLSPGSTVWFDTPFAKKPNRDVFLKGEARFEVAKNKQKPFTVYAGAFSTTALGTAFTVTQQNSNIRVQLLHGKVVIKNTDNHIRNWKNIYLLPGQQMVYNDNDAIAKVGAITGSKITSTNNTVIKKSTQRETTDSLIFNGSSLLTVLQKLHEYYKVSIQFTDTDIKNISFTGVIVKKDSVQNILRVITHMNGLSVEGTDSSFVILKDKN